MSVKKSFITVSLDNLIPYENNPRDNAPAVPDTVQSIKDCTNLDPIEIDEGFVILSGHTRLLALKQLGYTETEVVQYEGLTDEQKRKYRILANKTNELAAWDFSKLEEELKDLDFSDFSFDDDFAGLGSDDNSEVHEDEVPELPEEPTSKVGDMWRLGEHRLICGDCTDTAVISRLMGGEKAKILFTSPPYSDMREYNGGKDLSVSNVSNFIPAFRSYTDYQCVNLGIQRKDNEVVQYWDEYITKARNAGYKLLSWNVWDKGMSGSIGQANAMFPLRHEWIFVFGTMFFEINLTIPKKPDSINDNRPKTKRNKDGTTSYHTVGDTSKPYKQMESILCLHPVLDNNIRALHPATFPVDLPAEYIKAMTDKNDGVIEPFGGSGTTMIACEQLNRKCFMCELDPHYCDVIIQRWENLTGRKAELIN